jgi:DNA repair protein RecN (Recombination protein N)
VLLELRIHNLAVIDELALEFGPGLNVLTGETGAGKSVIVGALGLILGEKASAELVRSGADAARVEAALELRLPADTRERMAEAGVRLEDGGPLIVSRQVSAAGRSRAYLNGQLVTNELLRVLGQAWVDIHGQHDHQSLFRVETHLDLLDAFAGASGLRAAVGQSHERIQRLRGRLRSMQEEHQSLRREREVLEHEVNELTSAALQPGEDDALEVEKRRLQNAERLYAGAREVVGRLYDAPGASAFEALGAALSALQALRRMDEALKEPESRLEAAYYEVEDLARQVREYLRRLEFAPERLEEVERRLGRIAQLKRRYGATIEDVLARQEATRAALRSLATGAEKLEALREELRAELVEAAKQAFALSEKRQTAARELERRVESELDALGMKRTRFRADVVPMQSERGLIRRHEKGYTLGATGLDAVEYLISPNVGEDLRPLTKIASGGEIARVMLALKTVLGAGDTVSTLVFDEVDAGIGGVVGTVIGRKMRDLAASRQVLCVTHLPQIAACAQVQIAVRKVVHEDGGQTRTRVIAARLDEAARVAELARMLGGDTETARAHAQELLHSR